VGEIPLTTAYLEDILPLWLAGRYKVADFNSLRINDGFHLTLPFILMVLSNLDEIHYSIRKQALIAYQNY
jgi:hypothetical protein